MKWVILSMLLLFHSTSISQDKKPGRFRFTLGLSAPEMLHGGVLFRLANASAIGFNAGIGPSSGKAWTSLSIEHRLYLGKNSERSNQKCWFFRLGSTYFPSATLPSQHFTLNCSGGKDIVFKNQKNGITIDAGVFYLPESGQSSIILIRSLNLWPSLRFQLYFGN